MVDVVVARCNMANSSKQYVNEILLVDASKASINVTGVEQKRRSHGLKYDSQLILCCCRS